MHTNTDHQYIRKIQEARTDAFALDIRYMAEADSTNKILCEAARAGEEKNVLLIAETQTAGRGRFDRRFFSPAGTGIYMSLLLHPTCAPAFFPLITPMAGAAAAEAFIFKKLNARFLYGNNGFFEVFHKFAPIN